MFRAFGVGMAVVAAIGFVSSSTSAAPLKGVSSIVSIARDEPASADLLEGRTSRLTTQLAEHERVLSLSPDDAALRAASDEALVDLAIRCVPVEHIAYCLHSGWVERDPESAAAMIRAQIKQGLAQAVDVSTRGDATAFSVIQAWAALPYAELAGTALWFHECSRADTTGSLGGVSGSRVL